MLLPQPVDLSKGFQIRVNTHAWNCKSCINTLNHWCLFCVQHLTVTQRNTPQATTYFLVLFFTFPDLSVITVKFREFPCGWQCWMMWNWLMMLAVYLSVLVRHRRPALGSVKRRRNVSNWSRRRKRKCNVWCFLYLITWRLTACSLSAR